MKIITNLSISKKRDEISGCSPCVVLFYVFQEQTKLFLLLRIIMLSYKMACKIFFLSQLLRKTLIIIRAKKMNTRLFVMGIQIIT